ncbi:MAG: hypothetical protein EBT33_20435, partial [Betaproteobacteria bacterium]|nr:hypothetical protein [Betaproteobacteria bacterium]
TTRTTLTDAAGNVSTPSLSSFTLDTLLVIEGTVNAGPVSQGVQIEAFDPAGVSFGSAAVKSDGSFRIEKPSMGDYRGTVLVKAVDQNASGNNFLDEVTATPKSLDAVLRAVAVAEEGAAQFQLVGGAAVLTVHITPVSELAARKAGVTKDRAPEDAAVINQANENVAGALGLSPADIVAQPIPTNSQSFAASDGLSPGERYGLLLTKLSGLDSLNAGSIGTSLAQIEQNLQGSALSNEGKALIDQGRQQALSAMKAAQSSEEKTFLQDTPLNRQLLGDIVVTEQAVVGGKLKVTGTALPGSSVVVKMPDGSNQTALADERGVFEAISANPPPTLETKVELVGQDGLAQAVAHKAPATPMINAGNGTVVTGSGTPGTTVTVTDLSGRSLGTAKVDSLGQWSLTPPASLADDQVLKARAVDDSGNVSATGEGAVDIEMVSVQMPSAGDGYISAAERASGAVRYEVALPGTAVVGDQVRTTLSRPDGSTITYVDTLTADDLAAKRIVRPVPVTDLVIDGEHRTAISLVTTVGSSVPAVQSFILDVSTPLPPVIAPSNGQVINGTAEPGTTVVVRDQTGVEVGKATVGVDGNWTIIPARPLPNGTALSALASDPAGNTSTPATGSVVTGTLLITGAVDSAGPVVGLLADGATTNDTSPLISGTLGTELMAGQSLVVYRREGSGAFVRVGVARTEGLGFTFQDGAGSGVNAALPDGRYTWRAQVETAAGPVLGLAPSGEFDLFVDDSRPKTPTVLIAEASGGDSIITAAERVSDGGVPVMTVLGATVRAGDVVTTQVSLPDGSTRLLSNTLSQADVLVGRISQLIPRSSLANDGGYVTSTTITSGINGRISDAEVRRFTVDTTAPVTPTVALPESSNGVSAAEAASVGGTPILVTLTADLRIGDTVKSVVTSPNGGLLTLTTVLTASDLPPSQGGVATGLGPFTISQVIPSLMLSVNGVWTTVTTISDLAGNTSPAASGSFTLDVSAPSAASVSLPESPNGVSAAEAASAGGTPVVVTLSPDLRVGDTVSTVVTDPNGAVSMLTTVLSAADLPPSQGGTAGGSGPFTISQLIPSSALIVNGAWTTSTTITDVVGNASAATSGSFRLDTSAPSAPSVSLPESPNGVS